jgi:uncharacterized BrkB/YihY/UPF0761 family membrane protein
VRRREETMVLDYVALGVIFFMLILLTVSIVSIGSVPGIIARRRGHPWPHAVNAAGWVGLVSVMFWPLAFVWAFLPLPARPNENSSDASQPDGDTAKLEDRIAALEGTIEKLQSPEQEGAA